MIISSRRLAQMARKWLRAAVAGRERIAFHRGGSAMAPDSAAPSTAAPAEKGHFVVYSSDGRRFEVPLAYLKRDIFVELLRMSEDVFGLPGAGPITLPCDVATLMATVVSCLRILRPSSQDAERALLASMAARRPCSASLAPCSLLSGMNQQFVACGC